MKKLILSFAIAALTAAGVSAQSVHFGLGATVGTDTFGAEAALSLGDHFIVRGGYGTAFNILSLRRMVTCDWENQSPKFNGDVAMRGKIHTADIRGLVDFLPFRNSSFRLTLGAYYGDPVFLKLDNFQPLPMDPSEYGTSGFVIGDKVLVSDKNGYVRAEGRINALKPYAGIGFGRALRDGGRASFTFDMGALVWGSPAFYGFDKGGADVKVTSDAVDNRDYGIFDKLASIPVCPILRFGFYIQLF